MQVFLNQVDTGDDIGAIDPVSMQLDTTDPSNETMNILPRNYVSSSTIPAPRLSGMCFGAKGMRY